MFHHIDVQYIDCSANIINALNQAKESFMLFRSGLVAKRFDVTIIDNYMQSIRELTKNSLGKLTEQELIDFDYNYSILCNQLMNSYGDSMTMFKQ